MNKKPTYEELEEKVKRLEALLNDQPQINLIQELKESESRFKALSDAAHEGIFIHDNGLGLEVNNVGCEMFGYEPGELIGRHALEIFTEDSRKLVMTNIKNGVTHAYEATGLRKDGSTFTVEITGKNCIYHGKEVRVAALRDVTERKIAEQALKDSESKFREVFENAGDGILIGDLQGRMVEVNEAFLKMTGYDREDIIGFHIKKIFSQQSLSDKPLRFDMLNKGQTLIFERDITGKEGQLIPVEMNSKRPHANYYLSIIRDLRERRRAASELERKNKELLLAKQKAEESDRLKSSFLANMSHEIRTPMNGILGFAELVRAEDCDDKTRMEYLDVIISSGHQLLDIINDVLEISRIETGQINIMKSDIKVNDLLRDISVFFQPLARQNHNTIQIDCPENSEMQIVYADEMKVRQVLTNLVNNALKFTLNGTVKIGYEIGNTYLKFFVQDTGIGIPADFLDKVFERFLQAEYNDQMKQRGTGLGLAICKRLIEIMEGDIWVQSVENEGSTFYFTLPLDKKKN
nr:PAS domain S-box protein [uncultured Carboxylicivirga sp.]